MNTKPKNNTESQAPSAEIHELRAKILFTTSEIEDIFTCIEEVIYPNIPKSRLKYIRSQLEFFNRIHSIKFPILESTIVDGRSLAWTQERRDKLAQSQKERFEAKRKNEKYYVTYLTRKKNTDKTYSYTTDKEEVVEGIEMLGKIVNLGDNLKYLRDRINLSKDGQLFKLSTHQHVKVSLTPPIEKPLWQLRDEFADKFFRKNGILPNDDNYPAELTTLKDRPKTDRNGKLIRYF